ncbi:MAG: glycoside hydrolase family 76 protein [Actinomycetota bacterium]|nr:glycoside hydrolase family 76 protein [Actinomycetota bacterium]
MVATLDLAGVDPGLTDGFDPDAEIADRLKALERYYDPDSEYPAYASDPIGTRFGGDRYYDDNAWVGLALVQLERLRPGGGHLDRAEELFRFAFGGWDRRTDVPSPGGVFWVEQGHGVGAKNHDRNTVSNAPNAELGLHLAELEGATCNPPGPIGADDMYEWVLATLDASRDGDAPATGLFWDKLRGDNTIDKMLWSYNQGSMVGLNVLLARRGGDSAGGYLARAEAITGKALRHYADGGLERQLPSFNAIFFRNLLLLHAATGDDGLRSEILGTMRGYAEWAWRERRYRGDHFDISDQDGLLDQSGMVQVLALLAWDAGSYGKLA